TPNAGSSIGTIGAALATGAVATPAISTPKSSGSVCAVTSYGRIGGPPGYSCRFGYFCRSSTDLAYPPIGCDVSTTHDPDGYVVPFALSGVVLDRTSTCPCCSVQIRRCTACVSR